ncbi:acyl-CoA dehydrogenase family protein [Terrabacter sp. 2RAF25]|uniref:acyl-CoA dehydrogenase family protein n=1 Tax=Terrabacter sp. 2RAF25 TaxID=3232998 RepID=UPI003F9DF5C2
MTDVLGNIKENASVLKDEAKPSDDLGRLTDRTASVLRESGVIRLYQPKEFGGYEAHPVEFMEAAMAVGAASPSAGWVTGVVGVHPWEIAMFDTRLQEEIWGEDPDTWTASPYAPFGRATKVDGGFLFTGQWPYSTGTDHSEWVILGGLVVGDDGEPTMPPDMRHFVIPRKDYEIVDDSWNVLGLKGTGSKDVRMTDVFIPDYRVVEAPLMLNGAYEDRQPGKSLYRLKFPVVFSAAINSGTLGIVQGALDVYRSYMEQRVSADGRVARRDPIQLNVYGEAAADVAASRTVLLNDMKELFDHVDKGGEVSWSQRLTVRRNGVRAVRRAVDAVDRLYKISGAQGIHERLPNERYWRDMQAGLSHICNVSEAITVEWATDDLGGEASVPPVFA